MSEIESITMEMLSEGLANSHCPPMNADRLRQIYAAMRKLEPEPVPPSFEPWATSQGYDVSLSCIGIGYATDDTAAAYHGWRGALELTSPKSGE